MEVQIINYDHFFLFETVEINTTIHNCFGRPCYKIVATENFIIKFVTIVATEVFM